jgi:hypothetical protein
MRLTRNTWENEWNTHKYLLLSFLSSCVYYAIPSWKMPFLFPDRIGLYLDAMSIITSKEPCSPDYIPIAEGHSII